VEAEKYKESENVFYVLSQLTSLLTFNFWSLVKKPQRRTLFHIIIDDVFVVVLNVQS